MAQFHFVENQHLEEQKNFWKRCVAMAKEQKARFYILRRCVVMLLCWHKYGKYN
ncbi:hypothetical protein ACB092_06G131500 [Castanea dentata]